MRVERGLLGGVRVPGFGFRVSGFGSGTKEHELVLAPFIEAGIVTLSPAIENQVRGFRVQDAGFTV